jgi:hypothetical protein
MLSGLTEIVFGYVHIQRRILQMTKREMEMVKGIKGMRKRWKMGTLRMLGKCLSLHESSMKSMAAAPLKPLTLSPNLQT